MRFDGQQPLTCRQVGGRERDLRGCAWVAEMRTGGPTLAYSVRSFHCVYAVFAGLAMLPMELISRGSPVRSGSPPPKITLSQQYPLPLHQLQVAARVADSPPNGVGLTGQSSLVVHSPLPSVNLLLFIIAPVIPANFAILRRHSSQGPKKLCVLATVVPSTCGRSDEVRQMRWQDIILAEGLWL